MSSIKTLFTDSANTNAIYPRTKLNAVSDADGNTLGNVSLMTSTEVASGISMPIMGVQCDLLWTNSSPTSAFASQTISLDLSNYLGIYLVEIIDVDDRLYACETILKNGISVWSYKCALTQGNARKRNFTVNSNGVVVGVGYEGTSTQNKANVPYKIYGIKGVINE